MKPGPRATTKFTYTLQRDNACEHDPQNTRTYIFILFFANIHLIYYLNKILHNILFFFNVIFLVDKSILKAPLNILSNFF